MSAYLVELALRLARGVAVLPPGRFAPHIAFLRAAQQSDGGFAGREGTSDAYYASFALRALAVLGHLDDRLARPAADFLDRQLARVDGSVDFLSAVFCAAQLQLSAGIDLLGTRDPGWRHQVDQAFAALRREDGGVARNQSSGSSSTYHTFLVVLAGELLGQSLVAPEDACRLVRSRARDDGGFVEIAPMRASGTNPTAAAVALLSLYDALDETTRRSAQTFLVGMQSASGGLTANTRIPVADLLSTFTGLATLRDLVEDAALPDVLDAASVLRYVESLERSAGGFVAGVWDQDADVEYTFYGVGCLALLAQPAGS